MQLGRSNQAHTGGSIYRKPHGVGTMTPEIRAMRPTRYPWMEIICGFTGTKPVKPLLGSKSSMSGLIDIPALFILIERLIQTSLKAHPHVNASLTAQNKGKNSNQ
jgi:hypothetical protein